MKKNRLMEKVNYKNSLLIKSNGSDQSSSGSGSDGFNLPQRLIQFIMVEYSDGYYNPAWL